MTQTLQEIPKRVSRRPLTLTAAILLAASTLLAFTSSPAGAEPSPYTGNEIVVGATSGTHYMFFTDNTWQWIGNCSDTIESKNQRLRTVVWADFSGKQKVETPRITDCDEVYGVFAPIGGPGTPVGPPAPPIDPDPEIPVSAHRCNGMAATAVIENGITRRDRSAEGPQVVVMVDTTDLRLVNAFSYPDDDRPNVFEVAEIESSGSPAPKVYLCGTAEADTIKNYAEVDLVVHANGGDDTYTGAIPRIFNGGAGEDSIDAYDPGTSSVATIPSHTDVNLGPGDDEAVIRLQEGHTVSIDGGSGTDTLDASSYVLSRTQQSNIEVVN